MTEVCVACERADHSAHFEELNDAFRCLNLVDDEAEGPVFCGCDVDVRMTHERMNQDEMSDTRPQ